MPPTDCFDSSDAASSSLRSCSEPQMQPLPTKRSPLHHGTDPDLSSPTLLPAGVALSGIDLSPLTAGSCSLPVTKRKHRCHMVAAMSSQPSRLSRGLLSDRKVEVDATRAATHEQSGVRPQQQSSSATKSGGSYSIHGFVRDSADDPKAAPAQFVHPRVESNESNGLDDAAGGHPPVLVRLDSSDNGDGSQPSELPRLKSSYSYPESLKRGVCVPRVGGNEGVMKGVNENHHHQLKNTSLEAMMAKARVASDNIILLLHAQRCDGISCLEPGCASARQLVEHMRSCGGSPQEPCGDSKCWQAHKILLHHSECSRRRAFGGRYCLVCSLVARCTGGGAGVQHRTNINMNTSGTAVSFGSCSPLQGRQPMGYVGPVSAHRRGSSTPCVRESGAWGASGSQPPATISRFTRRDRVRGTPASHSGGTRETGAAGAGVVMGRFVKDGVFLRPLPKARSGSWGGYDRRRCMRRTRIDSIPEEQAETEEEAEDNHEHQDASPEKASKSSSKSSSDMSQEGSHKGKTLLSSLSL